jgi:hypothetical protein
MNPNLIRKYSDILGEQAATPQTPSQSQIATGMAKQGQLVQARTPKPAAPKPASTSKNIQAAGAAFQSQQPAQTTPGGGPSNAAQLAAKLGQTPTATAAAPAAPAAPSLDQQKAAAIGGGMAAGTAAGFAGQDQTRDQYDPATDPTLAAGKAELARPEPVNVAAAPKMGGYAQSATGAEGQGGTQAAMPSPQNTVTSTSGSDVVSSSGKAITSGAGIKKDAFGTPQFEEELEEETDESLEEQLEEAFNEMLRLSGIQLNEKAVSKQQQKFMGMVHAMQKGEKVKGASPELKKAAKGMGKKDAKDFASTKHKGLPQKVSESVMLEAGSNLEHIVTRFKHETKRFLAGDDLDSDLYEALYDYYADAGEMPYGVAKAREGDPYQWVSDHFADELALMGYDRQFQETVMPVVDNQLSELARLAGLSESRVDECGDMGMDQRDSMNVSTNMSSDGTKSVTISAQGDQAEALIQMLKLAGMGHMGHSHDDKPVMVVSKDDDEMMDEEYKNSPNNKEYHSVASILSQGNDLNKPKNQDPGTANRAANPMAEEIVDEELQGLLDSVLIKADEGSIKGGDRPGDLTGTWSADPSEKGKPNVPPPIPMDPVSPAAPKAPSSPAIPKPGIKK